MSVRMASLRLQISRSSIHKVLYENLRLYTYEVQLLQALNAEHKSLQKEFAMSMLDSLDSDPDFS